MDFTPTPHNAAKKGDFAKIVLMPGDPLRAKFIADTFLEDVKEVTGVRNMLGFTGTYNGKPVSVMGSGMGMPSIGIYSYELFNFYDVDIIVRIGSIGGIADGLNLGDVVVATTASYDSNYPAQYRLPGVFSPAADFELCRKAVDYCEANHLSYRCGNVLSSDIFYNDYKEAYGLWKKMGIIGAEMESCALYCNAARAGKRALAMFTVSDLIGSEAAMTAEERQNSFTDMMKAALSLV